MDNISSQYLANWHDSFVNYITSLQGLVAELMARPEVRDGDKAILDSIKIMLNGQGVMEVERDLATGVVKRSTLDKIAKQNRDLVDICLEHIEMNALVCEFWKQMAHIKIEYDKASEIERLHALQIPLLEG